MAHVNKEHLKACLLKLRDLRLWAVTNNIDPWAVRQTLVIALEIDTKAALDRGIKREDLENFDKLVKEDVQKWMASSPAMEGS
jgi:hypothetical protein